MREVKFRGLSNGEWVYGNLFKFNGMINKDQCYISDYGSMIDHTLSMNSDEAAIGYFKEVDSKTVGQFTSLKDKNGTEIYEGDILTTDLSRPYLVVEFRNGAFMFQCHDNGKDYYDFMTSTDDNSNFKKYHEVIGNIYEHPELLEMKE